jgi:hypothetical protein
MTYQYDVDGNLTDDGTWNFTYDDENIQINATSNAV